MNNGINEEILKGLNAAQRSAVEKTEGPLLIVAGAGSGKTKVLTCRIANIIAGGVAPSRILALTFTKKAAGEMKERIAALVGSREATRLWMGTFHAIFVRFLREYADLLGYPKSFTIYDSADTKASITKCLKELGIDDKSYKPSAVASRISKAKNDLLTAAAYARNQIYKDEDFSCKRPRIAEIYALYAAKAKASGAMDFDDILLNTNILFRDHPEALEAIRSRFSHILVDEYQDTNYAQYLILKKLSLSHRNICVVGDDSQSIYGFRGARIENILNFQKDYPEAQVIRLEQNYRSTQTIVDAANSLIDKNKNRLKKVCYSKDAVGDKIHVINAASDFEEGFSIASSIKSAIFRHKAPYSDFAVLYRTNAQSRVIEEALRKLNLPCRVVSGTSFFERAEVKDMVAYFRLVINPRDNEAFRRTVNLPARGIGETSVSYLEKAASQASLPLLVAAQLPPATLMAAGLKSGAISKMSAFADMILSLHSKAESTDAYTLASEIGLKSGLLTYMQGLQDVEDKERLGNVQELFNGIRQFCDDEAQMRKYDEGADSGEPELVTLSDYIENFTLLSSAEKIDDGEDDNNRISLMTVHSSKGLEYPYVYIAGLEENLFPSASDLLPGDIEEERRLFYVALTRAKKEVTLSYASARHRYGKEENNLPSRFIKEIDPQYLDGDVPQQGACESGWGSSSPARALRSARDYFFPRQAGSSDSKHPRPAGAPQQSRPSYPKPTSLGQRTVQLPSSGRIINRTAAAARPAHTPGEGFIPSDPCDIRPGMRVEHNIFGYGKIVRVEGVGAGAKAEFVTDSGESKVLILKFAKLRICD